MTEQRAFVYGTEHYDYLLSRSDRKSLAISVLPDTTIEVVAPMGAAIALIERRLHRRAIWIRRQLQYFAQFHPRTLPRKYVAGETHFYLGRRYRLKISQSIQQQVKLKRGFIELYAHRPSRSDLIEAQLEDWYKDRARDHFAARLVACAGRFPDPQAVMPTGVIVRQMSARWGSMSAGGRLVLNRRLIQAATHEIDYVIVHELCHRVHHHHGPEFYKLLTRIMPDWPKRKASLERRLV
jgi:predicted metal-dependent hydrolase